jgi:hypothetical protein
MCHSEARAWPRNLLFSISLVLHRCRELASLDCEL